MLSACSDRDASRCADDIADFVLNSAYQAYSNSKMSYSEKKLFFDVTYCRCAKRAR